MQNIVVNLEYYRIFYYVASCGSFSEAARTLCISQPAVSQTIMQLEKQLESKLFIRNSKGISLTTEGQMLYSYVKTGYEYILLGEKKFLEISNFESGEIRIGASDMTLEFFLLPFLEEFHKLYPNIKVSVTNAPTPETIRYLMEGKIDFGVISEPFETNEKLNVRQVKKINDIFVAGSQFEELKGKKLTFSELERLPIICLEKSTSTRRYVDTFLAERDCLLTPEFELATSDMIVQFARRGFGIGSVVENFARDYIKSGELFKLEFDEKIPERNMCIVTSEKIPISKAARKLIDSMI